MSSSWSGGQERHAAALVLRLDTPGGLADSMRKIISTILGSSVPVIGWVAPPGAHAASAGTYILYATQLAAMAPGTNHRRGDAGAAGRHAGQPRAGRARAGRTPPAGKDGKQGGAAPVQAPLSGEDAMAHKVTNDAVALIRSLAEMRGRNAEWAERRCARPRACRRAARRQAGRDRASSPANLDALLAKADGRTVEVLGAPRVLHTAPARVETVEVGAVTRLLGVLSNPNVALVLMMIGVYGHDLRVPDPGDVRARRDRRDLA